MSGRLLSTVIAAAILAAGLPAAAQVS